MTRDHLMDRLSAVGIETRPFFIAIHTLPPYHDSWCKRGGALPVTEALAATGINLPTFGGLSKPDLDRICTAILSARE